MTYNFFDNTKILAERVDRAWAIYKDETTGTKERMHALTFLIYAFDIGDEYFGKDALNARLTHLMNLRAARKAENPEYLPILQSAGYDLRHQAQIVAPIPAHRHASDPTIRQRIADGDLLDVGQEDKLYDRHGTTYLTSQQRAEYRVDIFKGHFFKAGKLYDTSSEIAHGKPEYVAFTLNANGELSAFRHLGVMRDPRNGRFLAHSSMNEGSPVLAAGEMKIKNGKLISLNTFSGHYRPSLFSVARFLEYLGDRGVDISKTKVYLQNKPHPDTALASKQVRIMGDPEPWYEVKASDVVLCVQEILRKNAESIHEYTNSFKTRLYGFFGVSSTVNKVSIAQDFQTEITCLENMMKSCSSLGDVNRVLDFIDQFIERYEAKNMNVENTGYNGGRLGSKLAEMRSELAEYRQNLNDCTRESGFKQSF